MEKSQLQSILKTMEQVVKEAGADLMDRERSSHVHQKGFADYVTEVDLLVQQKIRSRLSELYPSIQFMGEEQDNSQLDFQAPLWILDPVDGTCNLIRNMKMSVISLALADQGDSAAGVIYQPYTGELFSGARGLGVFVNGMPIHVSQAKLLKDAVIGMGTSPYHSDLREGTMEAARKVFLRCMDLRRSGSAAMDLAYIAAGRLDGMFELILQPWDVAAGKILVEEAGGTMTTAEGKPIPLFCGSSILATNGAIHSQLQDAVKL